MYHGGHEKKCAYGTRMHALTVRVLCCRTRLCCAALRVPGDSGRARREAREDGGVAKQGGQDGRQGQRQEAGGRHPSGHGQSQVYPWAVIGGIVPAASADTPATFGFGRLWLQLRSEYCDKK